MEGPVYPGRPGPRSIECRVPEKDERVRIDEIILDELVRGRFEERARSFLVAVIARGKRRGADGVVLGWTEIPLLISEDDSPLPILDSTRILARAALARRSVNRRPRRTRPAFEPRTERPLDSPQPRAAASRARAILATLCSVRRQRLPPREADRSAPFIPCLLAGFARGSPARSWAARRCSR
jgi:hypothetical protein